MAMGGSVLTKGQAKSSSIHAVVTRANGIVEDLGVVSRWHRNPLKHWSFNLYILIKRRFR
jgi:hypothetical protein